MLPSHKVTKYHRDYSLCSAFVSAEEYNVPSEVTDEFPNIQYFPVETAEPMGPLGGTGEHRSTSGGSLVPESVQKALLLMHLPKAKSAGKGNVKNHISPKAQAT